MFAIKYIIFVYLIENVSSDLLVQTNSGPVRGTSSLSEGVESFLGIPFAEPPVGDLRFSKPIPNKPWTEILSASNISLPCPQVSIRSIYFAPNISNMSEDCLYLNIWAPTPISNDTLKPVIIFLYPGSFLVGATNFHAYDGSNLAKRGDVIVVTTNYRLGSFGFLLAYIEEANGNMGIYDQVMAIKWMKENALAFGGDPENIVLMGNSAGAFSVSLHMMSPISKPLFHKAIIQSGGAVHPFIYDNNTNVFASSELVASTAGCANETLNLRTNPYAVIKCLKRQSMEAIMRASMRINTTESLFFFPRTGDEFLPQSPAEILLDRRFRTDIPVLTGITNDEGTLLLPSNMPDQFGIYGDISAIVNKDYILLVARTTLEALQVSNASEVLEYYMSIVENETAVGYSKMLANIYGDYAISCSTIFQADFFTTKRCPVYFYIFDARSRATPYAEWMGVTHLEDMQYIFGISYHGNFTDEDVRLSDHMMDRWSTFAKRGDPNIQGKPRWLEYNHKYPKYLRIQYEDEMVYKEPIERCRIWRTRFRAVID